MSKIILTKQQYAEYGVLTYKERSERSREFGDFAACSEVYEDTWSVVARFMADKYEVCEPMLDFTSKLGKLLKMQSEIEDWNPCYSKNGEQGRLVLSGCFGNVKQGVFLLFVPDGANYAVELYRHVDTYWSGMSTVLKYLAVGLAELDKQDQLKKGPLPDERLAKLTGQVFDLTSKCDELFRANVELNRMCMEVAGIRKPVDSVVKTSDWVVCDVADIRKNLCKTQKQMADDFGITRSTYQHYERDGRLPSELYAKIQN